MYAIYHACCFLFCFLRKFKHYCVLMWVKKKKKRLWWVLYEFLCFKQNSHRCWAYSRSWKVITNLTNTKYFTNIDLVLGCLTGVHSQVILLCFQISSFQDGIHVLEKAHFSLHPIFQKFPQCCLWNSSSVCLIDDSPLSSFQGRLSSASSFNTFSPRWSVVWCPWLEVSQVSALDLPRSKPLVRVALPASLSAQLFPFAPACPGQEFLKVDVDHWHIPSGLPIPLFTFCSKLIESVRMMACVVWLLPLEAIHAGMGIVHENTNLCSSETDILLREKEKKKNRGEGLFQTNRRKNREHRF